MEKVLLVSESEKGRAGLQAVLLDAGYTDIFTVPDAAAARRAAESADFALAVLNAPLSGAEEPLCRFLIDHTFAAVLLITRDGAADARLSPLGVMVLPKPLQIPLFRQMLRFLGAARQRMLGLRTENRQLQHQIDELRLINRAKCVLIQYLSIDEAQAHHYIEKQAMNRRLSRAEIAREILKTYEL